MAELVPVQFPAQMVHELHGKSCPACAVPVASVLVDSVVTIVPTGKPSALGVVEMAASPQAVMFTFQPCGCRTAPDGTVIPKEPPAEPFEPLVQIAPLPDASTWPSPVKSRRGGHRGRARRR